MIEELIGAIGREVRERIDVLASKVKKLTETLEKLVGMLGD